MTTIGIDWGEVRVGLAISDPAGMFAMPLCTLDVKSDDDAVSKILEVLADKEAERIVVGHPRNMDGTTGYMTKRVDKFLEKLRAAVSIPVEQWDERMSSLAADKALDDAEIDNRKRKGIRDRVAAQSILQGYLDSII